MQHIIYIIYIYIYIYIYTCKDICVYSKSPRKTYRLRNTRLLIYNNGPRPHKGTACTKRKVPRRKTQQRRAQHQRARGRPQVTHGVSRSKCALAHQGITLRSHQSYRCTSWLSWQTSWPRASSSKKSAHHGGKGATQARRPVPTSCQTADTCHAEQREYSATPCTTGTCKQHQQPAVDAPASAPSARSAASTDAH